MAVEVDHEEAYDVFYAELSSFTHIDVRLANRLLRIIPGQVSWTRRAREFEPVGVFRYPAMFLGREFGPWTTDDVSASWDAGELLQRSCTDSAPVA